MLVTRWFKDYEKDWYQLTRNIPATFPQQRAFYRGDRSPKAALPQASEEDIEFLITGCCCHPDELPA